MIQARKRRLIAINGKEVDAAVNAVDLINLPANTPFGNFTLKLMTAHQQLGQANRRLGDAYHHWTVAITEATTPSGEYGFLNAGLAIPLHFYSMEEAVYHTRRSIDELIAMCWVLSERKAHGSYPQKVKIDSIGKSFDYAERNSGSALAELVVAHGNTLRSLNDISNAFKHSFIQDRISMLGSKDPCVFTLDNGNNLDRAPKPYSIKLEDVVDSVSALATSLYALLTDFAE